MKNETRFEEVALELVDMPAFDRAQVMKNNDDAMAALGAYAQPVRPLELVRPPKPVATLITLHVHQEPTADETRAKRRKPTAQKVTWFELIALTSVTAMAAAQFGVLDLASLWT